MRLSVVKSLAVSFLLLSSGAFASVKIEQIREQIFAIERGLIESLRDETQTSSRIKRLKNLIELQKQEKILSSQRMEELEKFIAELESRREHLQTRIDKQRSEVRRCLINYERAQRTMPATLPFVEEERFNAPMRNVLGRLVERGMKEVEALQVDLTDADQIEIKIRDEKQQLASLMQDIKEQESLLEFHRGLQADILQRKHDSRIAQLEHYRKLRESEGKVKELLTQFNARVELDKMVQTQREASKDMLVGGFAHEMGKLPAPVQGKVVASFGRFFDQKSRLHIFKKGVDIAVNRQDPVKAVFAGKVVYSGKLADYGLVTIIDHGASYYSLCGNLGTLNKGVGDFVSQGDQIGLADASGVPLYFEIRSRNVAVNPLQWIANSFNF